MPKIIKTKSQKKKKSNINVLNPVVAYILSGAKGFAIYICLLLLITLAIHNGGEISVISKISTYFSCSLGAFISGCSAYKYINGRGVINGILGGLVYILIVLLCNLILLKLSVDIIYALILFALSLLCAATGGVVLANKK